DLLSLEYISSCDPHLYCPICRCPLEKPARLPCDHIFCEDCLTSSLEAETTRWAQLHLRRKNTCPECRTPLEKPEERMNIPRIILRMLDDLVVKCPNQEEGCEWTGKRAEVQDHLDRYCELTLVPCQKEGCCEKIARKYEKEDCLHVEVACNKCDGRYMKKDLDEHKRGSCLMAESECPHCKLTLPSQALPLHIADICPQNTIPCPGHPYGCPFLALRPGTAAHARTCPIALMTPTLTSQAKRQEEQEAETSTLRTKLTDLHDSVNEKLKLLESNLNTLQSLLYPSDNTSSSHLSTFPPSNPDAVNSTNPNPPQDADPIDGPTSHLLSLHESLRNDLSRLSAQVNDLDARSMMMLLNESQRAKEDSLHLNAAVAGLRAQVYWLLSARLMASRATGTT
ncbi:hypothetical protein M501DRAFT_905453, partial [Patellaria atrata CBS 101060]